MKNAFSPCFLNGWRVAGWGSLMALLLLPALAMRLTTDVTWTASDFVFAAILLGFAGAVVELAVRFARPGASRTGYFVAGAAAFLTLWSNAAIGIIGDEDAVNVYFYLMVGASMLAGAIVLFRPAPMRWITASLAIGQYAVGIAALNMMPGHPVEWGVITVFALMWLIATWCFHQAAITQRT